MLYVFIFACGYIFESQRWQVDLEKGSSCDMHVHILEKTINAVSEGKNCSIDRQVMFASINIVCDDL